VKRFLSALEGFWFVEGTSTRLAVLRIIVGVTAFAYYFRRANYVVEIASSPAALFDPAGLIKLLSAPVPVQMFQVLMTATLLANVAFILGWRFRRTGPLFAGLLLWMLCYRNSWSMIYHTDNLILWHVLVLGLTRSADTLSLDSLNGWPLAGVARRLLGREQAASPSPAPNWLRPIWHWEYGYPIMLLCGVTAVTYLLSGIAKVAGDDGWRWAMGDGLRTQVAFDGLRKEFIANGATPLAFILFNNTWLATVLGFGTFAIELGAPLALLDTRLGRLWAVGAFSMHWGIYAIMGIVFWYHQIGIAFVAFIIDERMVAWAMSAVERLIQALRGQPWQRVAGARGQGREARAAPAVTAGRAIPDPG
jgi:hypothetical protein